MSRAWAFDQSVPPRGYCWWYVDALSDDGRHGITLIAFIGTVFSPWYALARRGGGGDPENHCCLNVALYGNPRRWAMTDRRRDALRRDADHLEIGPSSLAWDGETLTIRIEETTAPIPSRLSGTVRLRPQALSERRFQLDADGRHQWQPIAARSRVEVAFTSPALRWSGPAYFDTNAGSAPLEQDFIRWDWCRAPMEEATAVLYNAERRDGTSQSLALRVGRNGVVEDFEPPPRVDLPRTRWLIPRPTRSETGAARVVRSLEDTPFYSRSEIRTHLLGQEATAVHESLSLDRFRSPAMYAMLPFKVPRPLR
ncbi:carotenoid 1,2-hydratase [Paeniroseomonas aquatica]|uniref:Carotenoid 1,2-hydratase n=1 Tax=Paeniroseomonas aquatica TaxID=373043 RepID=A0ABT8ACU6_9PROT|nr:carotenoid 1,2-hydratase [Paeniroseomonas aquatica]MDN3567582.1 carotenoid 1,2-hydratase [Paeniroseomonas aquatica]